MFPSSLRAAVAVMMAKEEKGRALVAVKMSDMKQGGHKRWNGGRCGCSGHNEGWTERERERAREL